MKSKYCYFDSAAQMSIIRKQLHALSQHHTDLLGKLIDTDEMIVGSFFMVYKTCSKKNCCCQKGKKHGPFAALSFSSAGRLRHKIVREDDKVEVAVKSKTYKAFQTRRKQLRKVENGINEQLDRLRAIRTREYE
jgi:hypothetical protein